MRSRWQATRRGWRSPTRPQSLAGVEARGPSPAHLKSWAEVMRLYAALKDEDPSVAIAYLLQARTGLRPSEALALIWAPERASRLDSTPVGSCGS